MSISVEGLTLRGRRVRYRAGGSGPAVVLVHGLGLSSRFYEDNYGAFVDAGFRIVAPDLPGFGGSAGPGTGLSVAETTDWLLEFADALGIARAAWVGHSLGGQPVARLAATQPQRAYALVLASPTGAGGRHRLLRQAQGLLRDATRESLRTALAVAREYIGTSPASYLGIWIKAARDDPLEHAPAIRCPTLLMTGTHDPIVPAAYLERLRQHIPAPAHVARIPGGPHGMAHGEADAFNRVVVEFLRTVTAGSGRGREADAAGR